MNFFFNCDIVPRKWMSSKFVEIKNIHIEYKINHKIIIITNNYYLETLFEQR